MAHVMGMEMPTQPQFSMAQPQGGVDGPRESKPQDEGRIFMGGLSHATTKVSIEAYCRQWCDSGSSSFFRVSVLFFMVIRTHPFTTDYEGLFH